MNPMDIEAELAELRAENARQAAAIAAKDSALRNCSDLAALEGSQRIRDAAGEGFRDPAPGWQSPEEAEALRAKAAEQGKTACELFDHLKASQKEVVKLREELATAREDSARLDLIASTGCAVEHPSGYWTFNNSDWISVGDLRRAADIARKERDAARNAGGAA